MNTVKKNITPGRFASFRITAEQYPTFSEAALRSYRLSNRNGFNRCVRKVGRRILIDLVEFESWVNEHRLQAVNDRAQGTETRAMRGAQ